MADHSGSDESHHGFKDSGVFVISDGNLNGSTGINNPALQEMDDDDDDPHNNKNDVVPLVIIERPVYSQVKFDEGYEHQDRSSHTARDSIKEYCRCRCSLECCKKAAYGIFPFLRLMRGYSIRRDFPGDVIAGLTVGIMHIPQGMAYGFLASLPPVYGLYTSFFPVLIYFLLGSSKHISLGTFAVTALMVGAVAEKGFEKYGGVAEPLLSNVTLAGQVMAGNVTTESPPETSSGADPIKLGYAMTVTFAAGAIQVIMGICHLGFVTTYLSDPLISGFTTAAACHVLTSQIKHVFGVSVPRHSGALKVPKSWIDFFLNIPQTNAITLINSLVSMAALIFIKECINARFRSRMKMPVPIELLVVVLVTAISYLANLSEDYNVLIVGNIPKGIPTPQVPPFEYLIDVIGDSVAIAIVSFAISVSMAKIIAKKCEYEVDANQELIAYGSCNVVGSFLNSFLSSASLSRSLIQEIVGGKTQIAGLVSSVLLLIVLLAIGPLFETLPKCILAVIVLVNLKGMFKQFTELPILWKISKYDFAIWVVTWLATVLLDVDMGLGIGVLFSVITVLCRSQRAYTCLLGRVPHTDIYRDINVYKAAKEISGIKIFRFEASLYFANAEHFRERLFELCDVNPRNLKRKRRKAEKKLAKAAKKKDEAALFLTITNADENCIKLSTLNDNAKPIHTVEIDSDDEEEEEEDNEDNQKDVIEIPAADIHHIILDCSTMGYLDTVGVKFLAQVINEYSEVDITVLLSQCKGGIREMMDMAGFYKTVDRGCLFLTIHDAVLQGLEKSPVLKREVMFDSPNMVRPRPSREGSDDEDENCAENGANNTSQNAVAT